MALPVRSLSEGSIRTVGGMRELIQDLVTPDLKATKASVEALQSELRLRTDSLSQEMKIRFESLQEELRLRDSIQSKSMQQLTDAIRELTRKVDAVTIDLRERVAVLEARLPRQ